MGLDWRGRTSSPGMFLFRFSSEIYSDSYSVYTPRLLICGGYAVQWQINGIKVPFPTRSQFRSYSDCSASQPCWLNSLSNSPTKSNKFGITAGSKSHSNFLVRNKSQTLFIVILTYSTVRFSEGIWWQICARKFERNVGLIHSWSVRFIRRWDFRPKHSVGVTYTAELCRVGHFCKLKTFYADK